MEEVLTEGKNFKLVTDSELPEIIDFLSNYLPDSIKVSWYPKHHLKHTHTKKITIYSIKSELFFAVSSDAEDVLKGSRLGFSFLRHENVAGTGCDFTFSRNDQDGESFMLFLKSSASLCQLLVIFYLT